jgi:hypothetical protein
VVGVPNLGGWGSFVILGCALVVSMRSGLLVPKLLVQASELVVFFLDVHGLFVVVDFLLFAGVSYYGVDFFPFG